MMQLKSVAIYMSLSKSESTEIKLQSETFLIGIREEKIKDESGCYRISPNLHQNFFVIAELAEFENQIASVCIFYVKYERLKRNLVFIPSSFQLQKNWFLAAKRSSQGILRYRLIYPRSDQYFLRNLEAQSVDQLCRNFRRSPAQILA